MTGGPDSEIGHVHRDVSGGWLRPAVFGAMDGLVTNIALIAGVGGSGARAQVVVLAGVAGLVAGACSMALGEYASVETQNDQVQAEVAVEKEELRRHPTAEQAELVSSLVQMGLTRGTAKQVAEEVHANPALAIRVHINQELGVNPEDQPSPWVAAGSSFLCFGIGALVPLVPYLLGLPLLFVGLAAGAAGLFLAGALTSRFTTRSWWLGGLRQIGFGAIAAVATYLIGVLIGAGAG
ncbi:MAG: vacuolar iron transporter family protein [Pseudonocardiales bacterium]|jgi:VIT1/CCC1 family predicted Fe2+/Mn2+ transporter|nr:vacuolar iron transporter family protein [Pseudonocardiales bacterium]